MVGVSKEYCIELPYTYAGSIGRFYIIQVLILTAFLLVPSTVIAINQCESKGVQLQVLGSGGPEILQVSRASSSYLIWLDGRARVLIDAGGGSALNYSRTGAKFEDLDAILLTHLHVDHSADLPAYIKGSYFGHRERDLPVFGPSGNQLMPSTSEFVTSLFSKPSGAFKYLSDFVDRAESAAYKIRAYDVPFNNRTNWSEFENDRIKLSAISVHHGPLPAVAWRVDIGGYSISFSGDMNGDYHSLEELALNSTILVANNAIPESAKGVARFLHMPPSVIGMAASNAKVKQLVLSHRMQRTLGHEEQTKRIIQHKFKGSVRFANDLDCFNLHKSK